MKGGPRKRCGFPSTAKPVVFQPLIFMIKNYMLDTNVLLDNPDAIFGFEDNNVWLSGTILQELNNKKRSPDEEIRYNVRQVARILDSLMEKGNLRDGVELPNGGHLFVEPDGVKQELLPHEFDINTADNRIISTCIYLNTGRLKKSPVILVTNDTLLRVNASVASKDRDYDIQVQSYRNDEVLDSGYKGVTEIEVTNGTVNSVREKKQTGAGKYGKNLLENEFCILKCGNNSVLTVYKNESFSLIADETLYGGIRPMNANQIFAIHALMAPPEEIPLVVLAGPAGTSKTFISLAAGLSQIDLSGTGMYQSQYRKMLISRPNVQNSDPGFGYLPGDLSEKMGPLMAAYYDNLETIVRGINGKDETQDQAQIFIDDLFENGSIELCPLNTIRGRSISGSYIICDEAQNASRLLIRDVITRAGKGSKVVVTGDLNQIDNPTVSRASSGLAYAIETMKGSPLAQIVTFSENNCVRSPLAEEAIKRMKG